MSFVVVVKGVAVKAEPLRTVEHAEVDMETAESGGSLLVSL